jgi:nucleoside-triphosphatase
MAQVCLLTGAPGTGKTTIIREVIARAGIKAGGFYTQELRVGGKRQGFNITTLDGQSAVLAHTDSPGPHRVGKYSVNVPILDTIGVTAIYKALDECDVVVIDEIGKMELFSPQFRKAVETAIGSDRKVLGTVMLRSFPFADKIKQHPGVRLIEVKRENRDRVLCEVLEWLTRIDEYNTETDRHR